MLNKLFKIGTLVLLVSILTVLLVHGNTSPKIAYVQSQDLIYGYQGTKDIMKGLETKRSQWQSNIDTLSFDFQKALNRFEQELPTLSEQEANQRRQALAAQQESSMKYAQSIEEKVSREEAELMEGVLNQVNAMAVAYGKEHGYSIIFGTTTSGNILHGEQGMNITDDLLTYMNNSYHAGS